MSSYLRRARRLSVPALLDGVSPTVATTVALILVLILGLLLGPIGSGASRATEGLLLTLPVALPAVVGSRWGAYLVAAAATVMFSLLIPPVGSVAVAVFADFVALLSFFGVALVVSTLVAKRIEVLGEVERQRAILLRSVSHDLRTPLATIRAAASELLDGGDHEPAARHRLLELVEHESDRLDRLVSNLLSLSRIEAGALRPNLQSVDLAELLQFCSARLERVLGSVHLDIDLPDDLPAAHADFTQLDLLFTNLIENAARHSPPDGTVVVAGSSRDGMVTIIVSDAGPGIDPSDVPDIFEPFRSGSIAGSSGIGLAICKAVAEAHGGTISVGESGAGGAQFTVTLPI